MVRKTHIIKLTLLERELLQNIVESQITTSYDKFKALVLLNTDIGEYGNPKKGIELAKELNVNKRSIVRVRQTYAKNNSIEDVFRITKKVQEDNATNAEQKLSSVNNEPSRKKNKIYIEYANPHVEGLSLEHAKFRVVLSEKELKQIEEVLSSGKHSIRKINRAKILKLANEGINGFCMKDAEIAKKLDVSIPTVQRVRKLFVCEGNLERVLNFNHKAAGRHQKIDGATEAILIATVCSQPPEGRSKWTLRLLSKHLIELGCVESISHVCVGATLKKMNLSLGKKKNG